METRSGNARKIQHVGVEVNEKVCEIYFCSNHFHLCFLVFWILEAYSQLFLLIPVFGLNTKIYSVNLYIYYDHGKLQVRKNSNFGHF